MTFPPKLSTALVTGLAIGLSAIGAGALLNPAGCKPPTPAQTEKAEADLCKGRAAERVIFAAAGGTLEPKPGTVRFAIEQAEDSLCASRAQRDGGAP